MCGAGGFAVAMTQWLAAATEGREWGRTALPTDRGTPKMGRRAKMALDDGFSR